MNTLLHGNFPKTAANKMFVTQICVPTERGNEEIYETGRYETR